MAKDKLTDYSATNASNTDVGGVNIDEGMLPSAVNNSIRELMTHLKEFSDGTSGIDVLSLADDDASASIKFQAPAAVTTTVTFTLPDGDGADGQALITNGSGTLAWAYPYGNRNLIINGAMQVAQRGTSAVTVNGSFPVDRWKAGSNASDFSAQQSTTVPSGEGFKYSISISPSSTKSPSSGTYFAISHNVEGNNIYMLDWGTSGAKQATLSFWVRSSKTGTYSVGTKNAGATRAIVNEYTISSADTWEHKTITIPGVTDGSWPIDNTRGLTLDFWLAGNNAATSTIGSWLSANANMSTNQVNFFDSTSNNFYLTGVQLEVGEQATPFEHRSYGDELARCQRYFQVAQTKVGLAGTTNGSTEVVYIGVPLNVPLRSAPSISGPTSYAARNTSVASSSTNTPTARMDNANSCILSIDQTGFSGFTDNRFACLHFSGGDLKMDAEL